MATIQSIALLLAFTSPNAQQAADRTDFFEKRVRPIFVARCVGCHGSTRSEGGLRLDLRELAMAGGLHGAVIRSGDIEHTKLLEVISHEGALRMPPAAKIPAAEIADLTKWIRDGAVWPGSTSTKPAAVTFAKADRSHWAFQPVGSVKVPMVRNLTWAKTPVDRFILAEIEKRGLRQSPFADRRTLIRRVTYDLTGLPPAKREVDQFITDSRPGAWERVIDRLLASPAYGERWGRHWLDVVRYADTAGETADYPVPDAWRYRNYVINSFNRDVPYDQFLREQIAGDLIARELPAAAPASRYAELVTATGYLAISRRFGFDPQNYHHLTIEDTLDTTGRAVLGLSIGCARCHDHKFDPISNRDYYSLYGIFSSTKYAFSGAEETKRQRDLQPLIRPSDAAEARRVFDSARIAIDNQIAKLKRLKSSSELELRGLVGLDGGFEFQQAGAMPGTPWSSIDGAQVNVDAQSPFTHIFPAGKSGAFFPQDARNNATGQNLGRTYTATNTPVLYLAVDFRNRPNASGDGSYRFYIGRGPGNSGAVEFFANGKQFFVKDDNVVSPICSIKSRQWNHVQVALDLKSRKWTAVISNAESQHRVGPLAVTAGWDGVVDYFFIDGYGHIGGVKPAHDMDNVALSEEPFPPFGSATVSTRPPDPAAISRLRQSLADLTRELTDLMASKQNLEDRGPFPVAYAVTEGTPADSAIQQRGDPHDPGELIPRGIPAVFGGTKLPTNSHESGRRQLAEWITSNQNPLTARVMVNRIWLHHFGRGIVSTPNDFGARGARPTNPQLLDWLAGEFLRGGWSIKRLHKLILMSSVYQLSADASSDLIKLDPHNELFAHFTRRRMDAEEIRDSLLELGGTLDLTQPEAHPFPPERTWGYTQHTPFQADYENNHRTVYQMVQRLKRHPFLALFDGADASASTPTRHATTVPTQALFFMNDPLFHGAAANFAARLQKVEGSVQQKVVSAYEWVLSRKPSAGELAADLEFVKGSPVNDQFGPFCRVLLASNKFLYVE